jgi:Uma2 family endonuclease
MVVAARIQNKTYADYLALPEGTKAELIDGELYMSPAPKGRHVRLASLMGARLGVSFGLHPGPTSDGPGGWWILFEPECHLAVDRRVVRPDLAGWRRERMPEPPSDTHRFLTVPDWVCEVLSPATQGHDMLRKMPLYLAAGVRWAWIVDPLSRAINVFRAGEGEWVDVASVEAPGPVLLPPFDAVPLDTTPWFGV